MAGSNNQPSRRRSEGLVAQLAYKLRIKGHMEERFRFHLLLPSSYYDWVA
jgi:hypothetical protein